MNCSKIKRLNAIFLKGKFIFKIFIQHFALILDKIRVKCYIICITITYNALTFENF